MGWMRRNEWRVVAWVAPVALAVLLITTNVRIVANSVPLYEALFERHGVAERTGIAPEELSRVAREVQAYLRGDYEPLQVTAVAYGVERELFTPEEASHMADAKLLFKRAYRAGTAAGLLLGAFAALAALRFRGGVYGVVAQWMRRGAAVTAAFVLGVGLLSVVAFEPLFTVFHYLGFPQGNWEFPVSYYLVRLFPLGFWFEMTLVIGALALIESAILWTIGFAAPVLTGARRPQGGAAP